LLITRSAFPFSDYPRSPNRFPAVLIIWVIFIHNNNNNNNVIHAPRPWRPFPTTLKINDAVAAQSYNNIHNDRDGNGVDAVYYTRLAVSESPIPHNNSGDETLAHVCANRPLDLYIIYPYDVITVRRINYVIIISLPIYIYRNDTRREIN